MSPEGRVLLPEVALPAYLCCQLPAPASLQVRTRHILELQLQHLIGDSFQDSHHQKRAVMATVVVRLAYFSMEDTLFMHNALH